MSPSPASTSDRAPRDPTDSSSSRESSPEPAPARRPRSFSPESESGDSAAPQITVRGSSPPQEQPVIRQGLAFRSATNISTYEPSVKAGDGNFLPGQEVQMAAEAEPPSAPTPVVPNQSVSSAGSTPAPPASSSNPATPSPHLSAMSTPSDKSIPPKAVKKASKATTKKPKQSEDNAFTTGRFRLSQYTGTPNEGLPPVPGQQTYASVYRPPQVQPVDVTPPGPPSEPSSSPVAASASGIPGTRIIVADSSPKTVKRSSKIQSFQLNQEDPADTSPPQSRNHPAYTNRSTAPQQIQITSLSPPPKTAPRVVVSQSTPSAPPLGMSHSSLTTQPPYYRRGHEHASQPRPESSRPQPPPMQIADTRHIDTSMAPPPPEIPLMHTKGKEREIPGHRQHSNEISRPTRGNVRLVTALIEDNRTNPPDHLLAEVYIRCWSGSRPDELWCDAKDLSEELQASASRIDGPAKVFTQRGAYRQCFLRITADQEDRYNSMNLALASDRTIPISVEYWAPPATQVKQPGSTADWRMSWHTSPTLSPAHPTPQSTQTSQPPYSHHQHPALPHHQPHAQAQAQSHHPYYGSQAHNNDGRHAIEASRKRYMEHGSPDNASEPPLRRPMYGSQPSGRSPYDAPSVSRNLSSAYPRKRHVIDMSSPTDDNMQVEGPMDMRPDYKASGYDSSQSEDVRHIVSEMIDDLLKVDLNSAEYNRSLQAPNLINTIHAYRMVDEICKKYVGQPLSVKGTPAQHKITEVDIARSLGAEDPRKFVSECRETLWLLDLYGERGKRGENPRVLEMLKDGYHSTVKHLQKVLKEIDAQWMREHSEGPGSGDSRPMTRMT